MDYFNHYLERIAGVLDCNETSNNWLMVVQWWEVGTSWLSRWSLVRAVLTVLNFGLPETMNSDGKSGPIREERCHRRDRSSPELPPSVFFLPFWWEIHLGVFLWGFFIPFWGPSLSFLCPGFQKYILPSFILKILFRVISCLMSNVQNGRNADFLVWDYLTGA